MAVIPRREPVSVAILLIGGLGYALLCGPAIGQRGFPPIDPIWTGVTFLWVIPLMISCWFDTYAFWSRRIHLCVYAIGTAFIDAGTAVMIVPKHLDLFQTLMLTVIPFGPIHVVVAFGLEAVIQGTLNHWRTVSETSSDQSPLRISLLAWAYFFTVLCIGIGFPFAFRTFVNRSLQQRGSEAALSDWRSGNAWVYKDFDMVQTGGALVEYEVDRETGLWIHRSFRSREFAQSYNQRMTELARNDDGRLKEIKDSVPQPDVVVELLDSTSLKEISEFPHEATPSIVLFRNGTISRWGSTMSSDGDGLSIATEHKLMGIGGGVQPIFVGIDQPMKGLVTVRNGKDWIGIYQSNGRLMVSASR